MPKRKTHRTVDLYYNQVGDCSAQSEVRQIESGYFNLKKNEFNEYDYDAQDWMNRQFDFEDFKKQYNRNVNGPKTRRHIQEPEYFNELLYEDEIQKAEFERKKAELQSRESQLSLIADLQESSVEEGLHFSAVQKNSTINAANPFQKSSITVTSNAQDIMVGQVVQIDSDNNEQIDEDSSQIYLVSQKKEKKNNINIEEQYKATHGPGLSNLLIMSLKERQKKKLKRGFAHRKLQKRQTKKPFQVPQQSQFIKLDD